jgi:glycosyltransferase involved in cell wall biosynthesis
LVAESLWIVTPWYPSPSKPFGGAFVRSMALAAAPLVDETTVLHLDEWPLPAGRRVQRRIRADLTNLTRGRSSRPVPQRSAEGEVVRLPIPVVSKSPYALAADHATRVLGDYLDGGSIDADIVHAHVGLPAGLAAVRLAKPGARVIVTEHATFLSKMLARDDGRRAYGEVIERCSAFLCVSQLLRDEVVAAFPEHRDKVHVVPNAVPFEGIPERHEPVRALRRWLYVGSLQERKGVRHLLEAFALCALDDSELRLTFVGGGPQEGTLAARVEQLGLQDVVTFVGPVQPDEIFAYYLDNELLVHPSRYETFGMTVIEAVATGLPVLVTRCGGPEETLGGLDGAAGELVDVGDGPLELVAGFRRLSSAMDRLDLHRARQVLETRYGYPAIEAALRPYYRPDAAPQEV